MAEGGTGDPQQWQRRRELPAAAHCPGTTTCSRCKCTHGGYPTPPKRHRAITQEQAGCNNQSTAFPALQQPTPNKQAAPLHKALIECTIQGPHLQQQLLGMAQRVVQLHVLAQLDAVLLAHQPHLRSAAAQRGQRQHTVGAVPGGERGWGAKRRPTRSGQGCRRRSKRGTGPSHPRTAPVPAVMQHYIRQKKCRAGRTSVQAMPLQAVPQTSVRWLGQQGQQARRQANGPVASQPSYPGRPQAGRATRAARHAGGRTCAASDLLCPSTVATWVSRRVFCWDSACSRGSVHSSTQQGLMHSRTEQRELELLDRLLISLIISQRGWGCIQGGDLQSNCQQRQTILRSLQQLTQPPETAHWRPQGTAQQEQRHRGLIP